MNQHKTSSAILVILCLQFALVRMQSNITSARASGDGRVFSLFSIVTFKNSACTSKTDTTMKGTCYTASECTSRGGTSGGNCAAGFGVCCTFTVSTCGSSVSQNCTYVQNPSFPSSYSSVSVTCSYTVSPVQSDICQMRLDFTNFVTQTTTPTGTCLDTFTVSSPSGATSSSASPICGSNTGQHLYVDTAASTTAVTLSFAIGATTATRTWKIKISQIECSNTAKAPTDCKQYFTGLSGTFKSYNFANGVMLASQIYTLCFRQELGYCAIDYSVSATTSPSPFFLGTVAGAAATMAGAGQINCNIAASLAWILIPGDLAANAIYCGAYLNTFFTATAANNMLVSGTVRQIVAPFQIGVISTSSAQTGTGFNLVYHQVPCQ